jgi:hypothetical protein
MLALVQHPGTPRRIWMPLLRHLFTFELMKVTLSPAAPADVKKAAEEALIGRLGNISLGEKLALGRRASGNVAGELLLDSDTHVVQRALENSRVTEASLVKAILHRKGSATLVAAVCRHAKWPLRREVRIALLRNEYTPLARALEYARALPAGLVAEIMEHSEMPGDVKAGLLAEIQREPRLSQTSAQ